MVLDFSRFLRRARPDKEGCAELKGRQIYILPTRYGILYALLLGVMLAGSINAANNLGFMLSFLLAGLGIVGILHTWHNLLGLRLQPGRVKPVFAGQEACFHVRAENSRGTPRPGILLERAGKTLSGIDLDSQASEELLLCLPAPKRGELELGRFVVSTRFPLGLLRAWSYIELEMSCLVYPRPGHRLQIPESSNHNPSGTGDRGVGTDDFAGLRPYRPGDPPRHINWKAAARGQGLQTKQFGGDQVEQRWLDWDLLPEPDAEARLSRLCRGVLAACEEQREFGLRLPGLTIEPALGDAHRHRCLAALACFGKKP